MYKKQLVCFACESQIIFLIPFAVDYIRPQFVFLFSTSILFTVSLICCCATLNDFFAIHSLFCCLSVICCCTSTEMCALESVQTFNSPRFHVVFDWHSILLFYATHIGDHFRSINNYRNKIFHFFIAYQTSWKLFFFHFRTKTKNVFLLLCRIILHNLGRGSCNIYCGGINGDYISHV